MRSLCWTEVRRYVKQYIDWALCNTVIKTGRHLRLSLTALSGQTPANCFTGEIDPRCLCLERQLIT